MRVAGWLASSLIFAATSWNPLLSSQVLSSSSGTRSLMMASAASSSTQIDEMYPGTAVPRMMAIRERVKSLNFDPAQTWESQRKMILKAGGLKDLQSAQPGEGYTGHSFNDFNHVDLTAMVDTQHDSENEGRVNGIHARNPLGNGIRVASLGPADGLPAGGSWSTCALGCNSDPPRDVAHVQFQSRIAFKLVWVPPAFNSFVLVDDDGNMLNTGTPKTDSGLPAMSERTRNYMLVKGSRYATAAEAAK